MTTMLLYHDDDDADERGKVLLLHLTQLTDSVL